MPVAAREHSLDWFQTIFLRANAGDENDSFYRFRAKRNEEKHWKWQSQRTVSNLNSNLNLPVPKLPVRWRWHSSTSHSHSPAPTGSGTQAVDMWLQETCRALGGFHKLIHKGTNSPVYVPIAQTNANITDRHRQSADTECESSTPIVIDDTVATVTAGFLLSISYPTIPYISIHHSIRAHEPPYHSTPFPNAIPCTLPPEPYHTISCHIYQCHTHYKIRITALRMSRQSPQCHP
ncbi:unnamed protein product [Oppiella nova]|uniref:Uncharacterized protein n=1 Tax=Oppiella nova TaxID=334625 RepID=A0A7R9L822_9ACAR|nr:unnamed protein product [Oppiella nova]CAG2158539.1 unnamed protein product [Oppiella nova]